MGSELIGIDIGQRHTGLARASSLVRLVEPLESIMTDELINRLKEITLTAKVEAIVIGLPRNLESDDTEQTRWVRQFTTQLKEQIGVPLFWQDEALTSQKAEGLKQRIGKRFDDHALAAAIILQDWIDTPEAERVRC